VHAAIASMRDVLVTVWLASNPTDSGSRRVSLEHAGGECRGGAVELSGCIQTDSPELAARRAWRTAEVRVTSSQDSIEHLVREEAMAPGSAGCYVAVRTRGAGGGVGLSSGSAVSGLHRGARRQRRWRAARSSPASARAVGLAEPGSTPPTPGRRNDR
jgi:hypothetical protein